MPKSFEELRQEVLAQKLQSPQQQRMSDNIRELHRDLTQINHERASRVPERVFVGFFLPVFAGDVTDEAAVTKTISEWYTIIGRPTAEAVVIDAAGRELYRVPPMANLRIFNPRREERSTAFATLTMQIERQRHISPTMAENTFMANVQGKLKSMLDPQSKQADNSKRWNAIFERYGIQTRTDTGEPAPTAAPAPDPKALNNLPFSDDDEIR